MSWLNQVGDLLKQYSGGATAAAAPAPDVHEHFDQVAQAAPSSAIAEGLAAAFRSNQTPAFGQMLSTLFTNSNADQKAGMLNQLISSVNPATLTQILSGAGLGGLLGGAGAQLTPDQAQQLSPEIVQQLAAHAEKANPAVVDSIGNFYREDAGRSGSVGCAGKGFGASEIVLSWVWSEIRMVFQGQSKNQGSILVDLK